jgi:peptidyl-prolyl cis-trans isomerase C
MAVVPNPGGGGMTSWRGWGQRLRSEPLVHFLLAGFAIFLFFAWRGEPVDAASRTINVDAGRVSALSAQWQQTWRRPPSPRELDGLIRDFIREEIYVREAIRLGLDQDDGVIRRRLRSKMEYLARAQLETTVPDERTLRQWFERNRDRYSGETTLSFDQIFLGETGDEARVRGALAKGENWQDLGKPTSLPKSLGESSESEVAGQFGGNFAASIVGLRSGGWQGPVQSAFGLHLVRVRAKRVAAPPTFNSVRTEVENDWRGATLAEREAKAYQALLDGYAIRIEQP